MTRRAIAAAATLALIAPATAVAVTDSRISIQVAKAVKPGKAFTLISVATFDSRQYSPPSSYLASGVWRHRGDEPCLKAVPIERSGWTPVGNAYTFYPAGDASDDYGVEFLNTKLRLKKTGTYRWCGYVYTTEYDSRANASYHVKARTQATTRVRR